ncbi:MAG: CpsB/CapC family capsule biosynthesis tyrosine phosphatase, partial [Sporosarcina sp.]
QEVRLRDDLLDKLAAKEALTLAKSRYLLLELPSQAVPAYTVNVIQALLGEGIIPIIAHPERNRAIAEKPERLERLVRHGALAQITAGSVAGHFGRNIQKLSLQLLEANLIHTYGSDVHNTKTRPLLFNKGLDTMEKKKLHDMADILLENNDRILKNAPLFLLEPTIPNEKKWWKLIG